MAFQSTRILSAFNEYLWPSVQDTVFTRATGLKVLLGSSLKGSREFTMNANDFTEQAKRESKIKQISSHSFDWDWVRANMGTPVYGNGAQSITNTPVEFLGRASTRLTNASLPVAIPDDEYIISKSAKGKKGDADTMDVWAKAFENTLDTMFNALEVSAFGDNNVYTDGILGLGPGIGTTFGLTYCGVDRSTYTTFEGNSVDLGLSDILTPSDATDYIISRMISMKTTVTNNGANPDDLVFIANPTIHNMYSRALSYTNATGGGVNLRGDLAGGFNSTPPFHGIPVINCANAGTGKLWLVDTKSTFFTTVTGGEGLFNIMEPQQDQTSTQHIGRIHAYLQLVVTNPRRNAVATWS